MAVRGEVCSPRRNEERIFASAALFIRAAKDFYKVIDNPGAGRAPSSQRYILSDIAVRAATKDT
jgi:hypothetical protein